MIISGISNDKYSQNIDGDLTVSNCHFLSLENMTINGLTTITGSAVIRAYNVYFGGGLRIEKESHAPTLVGCTITGEGLIAEDIVALNIIGGDIERNTNEGVYLVNCTGVNIRGVYFEANGMEDILINGSFSDSVVIDGCYFNNIQVNGTNRHSNAIITIGPVKPTITNNCFQGPGFREYPFFVSASNNRHSHWYRYITNISF